MTGRSSREVWMLILTSQWKGREGEKEKALSRFSMQKSRKRGKRKRKGKRASVPLPSRF